MMAGTEPAPQHHHEILIRVNSRRGGNTIHPLEPEAPPVPSGIPVNCSDIKHFKKWFSWLVPCFVVANVVVFVITMFVNNCPKNSVSCLARFLGRFSFQPFSENPLLGPSSNTLEKMGALDVSKVVEEHQAWRLITCIWLHGGVFHLLANMLSLFIIGIRLEQEFGFGMSSISVGASGALFGLLGSMLSELLINWSIYVNKIAILVTLVVIIVINLAMGLLPHVDNFAHIGGFLSGFFLGFVFLIRPHFGWVSQRYAPTAYSSSRPIPKFKAYQLVLWVSSIILLIIGFTTGLVMLLRGVDLNEKCSWCHYLSCVPTSSQSKTARSLGYRAQTAVKAEHMSCQMQVHLRFKGYAVSCAGDDSKFNGRMSQIASCVRAALTDRLRELEVSIIPKLYPAFTSFHL
nr:RHOMBOID-like protein 1 [Ipomoea batatas]